MKNLKTQEKLRITDPSEALDAIKTGIGKLLEHPEQAEQLDGATLKPVAKIITREGVSTRTEYAFDVVHDGAGLPETQQVLVEA
jgi:hypothetical protein